MKFQLMHKLFIWTLLVIIFVFFANIVFAIHQEPEEFPIIPEITCTYNKTYGLLEFNITNTLGRPLHLDRVPVFNATTITHLSTVFNGRIVEPDQYCTTDLIDVKGTAKCTIYFDPQKYKTGIFRFFHDLPKNLIGHFGRKVSNVLRLRILDQGSKYRKNFRFDCINQTE